MGNHNGIEMSRKAQLLAMIEADPNDPFLIYALALEVAKEGNIAEAIKTLEALKMSHPDYLGLYHQLAQWQLQSERYDEGLETLSEGIIIAKDQGNLKASNEMKDTHWQYSDED